MWQTNASCSEVDTALGEFERDGGRQSKWKKQTTDVSARKRSVLVLDVVLIFTK